MGIRAVVSSRRRCWRLWSLSIACVACLALTNACTSDSGLIEPPPPPPPEEPPPPPPPEQPAAIAIVSGNDQAADTGIALPLPFVVRVLDDGGAPVPDQAVTWSVASGEGTLSALLTTTDDDGRTAATLTLGPETGENSVAASVDGVAESVVFTATGLTPLPSWEVHSGNPVFDVGPAGSWDAGTVFDATVIEVADTLRMWYVANDVTHHESLEFAIGYAWSLDGVQWNRRLSPVLWPRKEAWDSNGLSDPTVLYDGDTYHMWYGITFQTQPGTTIGYASSDNGVEWTRRDAPVLETSPPGSGSWDVSFLLGPSSVLLEEGEFKMWYSGGTGVFPNPATIQTGLATSPDGINWTKSAGNPVLRTGSQGDFDELRAWAPVVLQTDSGYEMWYTGESAQPRQAIGYATSSDGVNWMKEPRNPVLSAGGWAFEFVAPTVLSDGDQLRMWMTGFEAFPTQVARIGYATGAR